MSANPDPDDLLLSDDERLHALNAISEHYAAGRLDSSEFYDRSGAIASARTLDAMRDSFRGLPGGLPLDVIDGHIRKLAGGGELESTGAGAPVAPPAARSDESDLSALRKRGGLVESLDGVIVGVTLVVFLVLQVIVDWDYAWIVWPSLIVTLSVPRMILKYSDADEEIYEELKEEEAKSRKKRLREAAERIHELEAKRDPDKT
ncbi:DUF1707 SHOCT-like domain-containing protein [Prescottella agglutinans]|uniref:DUF1707 domain-containing protein n=1 Tax=Prescottella agglutinans TaxID=1644129 RepID=A0ABT6MHM8_9NOCA|nr:DUF1707 domain-containing protein [Prescottella agglutinans]MDH6283817.1 hypothetical protein [Prescottella agglutinans]